MNAARELDLIEQANARFATPPGPYRVPEAMSDVGNAGRLIRRHGRDLLYVEGWGWVVWSGTHWVRDDLAARGLAIDAMKAIFTEAADSPDHAEQKRLAQHALRSQQSSRIQGALFCAAPSLAAKVDDFDRHPTLLPVANGTLDLAAGVLLLHERDHRLTRVTAVNWMPEATCPTWLAFLERVLPDPDVRAFIQRAVGYLSLTGSVAEQKLFFLFGSGRNGKSVFLEILEALAGEYATPTRMETLTINRAGIPNDIAALSGARVVTVSETAEGARLNESLVKDLTGGDAISARFLRQEFFTFRPQFKLWIRGNHKPQIRGSDDGIWRRLMLIPFTVQIPANEVDPLLPSKLREELPGILTWAVRGCLDWQSDGLRPPAPVTAAVGEYRGEMDVMGQFIAECCLIRPDAIATARDLYAAYVRWCADSGEMAVAQRRFGMALGERGFMRVKDSVIKWRGIGLLATGRDEDVRPCSKCHGEGCEWCA